MKMRVISFFVLIFWLASCSPPLTCPEEIAQFNEEIVNSFNQFQQLRLGVEQGTDQSSPDEVFEKMNDMEEKVADISLPACAETAGPVREALLSYLTIAENYYIQIYFQVSLPGTVSEEELRQSQAKMEEAEGIYIERFGAHQDWSAQLGVQKTFSTEVPWEAQQVQMASQWPILFADDFEAGQGRWDSSSTDGFIELTQSRTETGKYRWVASTNEQGKAAYSNPLHDRGNLRDFYISVVFEVVENSGGGAFGVSYRMDNEAAANYTFAMLPAQQNYAVLYLEKNVWTPLVDWTNSEAILQEGPNRVGVLALENDFIFLINGQVVQHIQDDRLQAGYVAIMVGLDPNTNIIVDFDDFELRSP